jgi:hypothetical protein
MLEGIGLGAITTPRQGNRIPPEVEWVADNGRGPKADGSPGDTDTGPWWEWLTSRPWEPALCRFAVAPDVLCDADATLLESRPWLPRIRALGYPAAYVAQNGATVDRIPWPELDVLFLGGDTDWKLGPVARSITYAARDRGVPVHMGRVNSFRRFGIAWSWGCSSADGTLLARAPDKWLPFVRRMLDGFEAVS